MNDKRKGLLFQTKKQMNNGAIATGLGFVLYLALLAMGLELPADLVAVAFGVVGIFNSLSVLEGRRKDKENISYNLLWGQLALTIFLVACAVLDLACGTGSMTWLLAGRGYELIAVDGSQEMLAAAREKNAPAEVPPLFLHQSMPRLDLYGTVDAAICCLDSLNYLTDPRDVQRTLRRLHLFISPGGLLTFDVRLPERLAALDGQVFLDETEDTYCVWRTEYRRGLCTYYMDLFTLAEDGSWDRSFELHRQRGYSVEQLTQWLEEAGFTEIRTWGDGKLRRPVPGEDRVYFTCIRK